MGRAPCCDKANVKKGPWSPEEDAKLKEFIEKYGTGGNWIALPQKAGLKRCGKSCRLRWLNYLRPNIKHGEFSDDEDRIICTLFHSIGSRWSIIAAQLPGRTDNDIKNYWNTKLKKKLIGILPPSQVMKPISPPSFQSSVPQTLSTILPSKCSSSTSPLLYSLPLKSPPSALEPIINISSIPCRNLSNTTSNIIVNNNNNNHNSFPNQSQESLVCSTLVGTELASCTSSDGSCNQISSHGKDIETDHQYPTGQHLDLQNFSSTDGFEEKYDQNKIMFDFGRGCNGWSQRSNIGFWGSENPLEYDLEEIKQLVSTNGCSSNYIDETKTPLGRIMYY